MMIVIDVNLMMNVVTMSSRGRRALVLAEGRMSAGFVIVLCVAVDAVQCKKYAHKIERNNRVANSPELRKLKP